ncbi:MAG: integrase core domain-containing protein [Patescibacteria group bacterium]|nr:integrase core domain-containing protein [Patescibacteria group bacterium]
MRIEPREIINQLNANGGLVRKTARELGISPGTVINWRNKAKSIFSNLRLKVENLTRESTKPKNVRQTILKAEEQDKSTLLRKEKEFCAIKICDILKLPYHYSTVHRFLKKKDLINSPGYRKRPLYQDTTHMHAKNVKQLGKLQMDVKYVTPELSGLEHTCYLYAAMDILSRYKQGIIFPLLDQGYSIEALKFVISIMPLKADFVQTDNGLEFQKRFLKALQDEFKLKHHFIHKSNPNENAVIERSFRTDEEEFFFFRLRRMGKPKDLEQLNVFYQIYLKEYNETRPHLSLPEMVTPLKMVELNQK